MTHRTHKKKRKETIICFQNMRKSGWGGGPVVPVDLNEEDYSIMEL